MIINRVVQIFSFITSKFQLLFSRVNKFPKIDRYFIGMDFSIMFKIQVMHGADKDITWLQRDFGIYVCNLFDTGQVWNLFFTFSQCVLLFGT